MNKCAYCGVWVANDPKSGNPVSKYWNKQHNMVFCGAKCSLDMHQLKYVKVP